MLQVLYAVKSLPELLSERSQEQLLQVALLADMWQIPKVSTAAVDVLASTASMTDTAVDMFLSLQAHPACILPLLKSLPPTCFEAAGQHTVKAKHILLSNFGDLEAVWADPALQEVLLGLRLPAMDLLLSFDELKASVWPATVATQHGCLQQCMRLDPAISNVCSNGLLP